MKCTSATAFRHAIVTFRFCSTEMALPLSDIVTHLCASERERLKQFRELADARAFAMARWAIRNVIGTSFDIPPGAVPIETFRKGKPKSSLGIHFSIAHSGSIILLAFGTTPLGADIEQRTRRVQWQWFSKCMSNQEVRRTSLGEMSEERMLRIWVRKEAVLKLAGVGLFVPPSSVCVPTSSREVRYGRGLISETDVHLRAKIMDIPGPDIASVATFRFVNASHTHALSIDATSLLVRNRIAPACKPLRLSGRSQ